MASHIPFALPIKSPKVSPPAEADPRPVSLLSSGGFDTVALAGTATGDAFGATVAGMSMPLLSLSFCTALLFPLRFDIFIFPPPLPFRSRFASCTGEPAGCGFKLSAPLSPLLASGSPGTFPTGAGAGAGVATAVTPVSVALLARGPKTGADGVC